MATALGPEPTAPAGKGAAGPGAKPYKQKVGHLRVDQQGEVSYKKTPSSTLMASLQLGLTQSIGSIEPKPRRDILMTDFDVIQTVEFPGEGSRDTPAHKFKDFTFKTYSPVAFRFFREGFQIKAEDYLVALCHQPMRELSNPGASGSLFYLSADDEFIIKTVQRKEAKFLQKLLPGYYLNITQNKKTLLPKFFGLYQYKCGSTKIRIVVMNNLLPSSVKYHLKFDLKGSTYKRKASSSELAKSSPTYKDLDFININPDGITLGPEKFDIVTRTLLRDCQVLESFGIMDFSLLLGVHNIDEALRDRTSESTSPAADRTESEPHFTLPLPSRIEARKNFSIISMEDIPLVLDSDEQPVSMAHYPEGYIQGRTEQGDRVLLYLGVIDILQSYKLKKRLEHSLKAIITDGDTVSVHNPSYYSQRFQTFVKSVVFRREKVKIRPRRNSHLVSRGTRKQAAVSMSASSRPTQKKKDLLDGVQRPSSFSHESPSHRPKLVASASDTQTAPRTSTEAEPLDLAPPTHSSLVHTYSTSPPHLNNTRADETVVRSEGGLTMSVNKSDMTFDLGAAESDFSNTIDGTSTPVEGAEPESGRGQEVVETVVSVIVGESEGDGELVASSEGL